MKTNIIIMVFALIIIVAAFIIFPTVNSEIAVYGITKGANDSTIVICLRFNDTTKYHDYYKYAYLENRLLQINLTDENGKVLAYNKITDSNGEVHMENLNSSSYNVSVIFGGDHMFKPSEWNGTIDLKNEGLDSKSIYNPNSTSPYFYNDSYYTYGSSPDSDRIIIYQHSYHI